MLARAIVWLAISGVASPAEAVAVNGTYQLGIPFPITSSMTFNVTYAGPAPGLVAGTSQVNFQVEVFPSNGFIYITLPSSQSPPFSINIQ
jgi:hypothetical protein